MEDFLGECDLPHRDAVMHSYEKSGRVYSGNRKKIKTKNDQIYI